MAREFPIWVVVILPWLGALGCLLQAAALLAEFHAGRRNWMVESVKQAVSKTNRATK